jgi:hypothetical protein
MNRLRMEHPASLSFAEREFERVQADTRRAIEAIKNGFAGPDLKADWDALQERKTALQAIVLTPAEGALERPTWFAVADDRRGPAEAGQYARPAPESGLLGGLHVADVPVIALAGLVVVPEHTFARDDERQAVLVLVRRALYRARNTPDSD